MALVGRSQLNECVGQNRIDDIAIVQIEPLEERLVQLSSAVVRCVSIELNWLAASEIGTY